MEQNYYSYEEIKEKFKSYKKIQESSITDEEYTDFFCDQIQVLPREIVDRVQEEIQFVLLSAAPKNVNPACYVNFKKEVEKEKEAIIVLTPYFFGALYIDENGEKKRLNCFELPCLLHEVAHHVLGHHEYKDQKDMDEKEKAAKGLAKKWIEEWSKFNDNK